MIFFSFGIFANSNGAVGFDSTGDLPQRAIQTSFNVLSLIPELEFRETVEAVNVVRLVTVAHHGKAVGRRILLREHDLKRFAVLERPFGMRPAVIRWIATIRKAFIGRVQDQHIVLLPVPGVDGHADVNRRGEIVALNVHCRRDEVRHWQSLKFASDCCSSRRELVSPLVRLLDDLAVRMM
jgi:hypothetical protein